MLKMVSLSVGLVLVSAFSGCKYYGSALPPEYPLSMDTALEVARDRSLGYGGQQRGVNRRSVRPRFERPSYIPEKELAVVAPPRTLLVWTYPHITNDNTRVFGSWSTIFLTDRYEWMSPSTEIPESDMVPVMPTGGVPVSGAPGSVMPGAM